MGCSCGWDRGGGLWQGWDPGAALGLAGGVGGCLLLCVRRGARRQLLGDLPSKGSSGRAATLGEPPDSGPTVSPAHHPEHRSWRANVPQRPCHLLKLHPRVPRGSAQAPGCCASPRSAGRSACMVLRFEGASLLTKGKFEIPFLEKNVPPSSRPLWPQGQNPVGIQVGSHIVENPF